MSKRTLGILVRQVRQSKGLTQYALAKDAGISTPYLQRLESGEYETFPPDLLVGVARVLGMAPETLLNEMDKGTASVQGEPAAVPAPEPTALHSQEPAQSPSSTPADSGRQQDGEPPLSLVPPLEPVSLVQEIASLSNEDQALVADFVQMLLKRRGQ